VGTKQPSERVNSVVQCVAPAGVTPPTVQPDQPCPAGTQNAPANGVLQAGDRIVAVNGVTTKKWADTVKIIEGSAGQRLSVTVIRDGATQTLSLTPITNTKYVSDDPNDNRTKSVGFIGVEMNEHYVAVPLNQIPGELGSQIGRGFEALGSFPSKIGSLFGTVFEGKPRDPSGAVGVVGLGRIGGEVASSSSIDFFDKVYFLLFMLAGVNLLLFLFNLVPLLPLDGGHVAGAIVESAKQHLARRKQARSLVVSGEGGLSPPANQPQPHYVDTAQMVPVLYGVAAILLAFTLLVVYADIVKPITIGG
jgi:membrane-associated protease RseP (regulator of RpoE activity)